MKRKNLYQLFKQDIPLRTFITKKLIGVNALSTIQDAAQKMTDFNISSIVVVKNNKVIGFFTESDLTKKVVAKAVDPTTDVQAIMNKELITIDITANVKEALEIMVQKDIKHLLVKENDSIVGVISLTDFLTLEKQKLETFIAKE